METGRGALIPPTVAVVMGVSGSGKSTVGAALAARLGWDFGEGDELHPPDNVAKMAAGRPLDDADRWPWLHRVRQWIGARLDTGRSGVVSCSALRRGYRDVLRRDGVVFVYLAGSAEVLGDRLAHRSGHFMPATLLSSQLATLEPPGADERAITVPITDPPAAQVAAIVHALGRS